MYINAVLIEKYHHISPYCSHAVQLSCIMVSLEAKYLYHHFVWLLQLLCDLERLAEPGTEYMVEGVHVEGDETIVSNSEVRRNLNFLQR